MNVGKPLRVVRVEPVKSPVPERPAEPVRVPAR